MFASVVSTLECCLCAVQPEITPVSVTTSTPSAMQDGKSSASHRTRFMDACCADSGLMRSRQFYRSVGCTAKPCGLSLRTVGDCSQVSHRPGLPKLTLKHLKREST